MRKTVIVFSVVIKPLVMDVDFVFPGFSNGIPMVFDEKDNIDGSFRQLSETFIHLRINLPEKPRKFAYLFRRGVAFPA